MMARREQSNVPAEEVRTELHQLLAERAFITGDFLLSSGRRSSWYFDGKQVTLDGRGLFLAATLVLERCRRLGVDAIGGLTMGADPLTAGVVALSGHSEVSLHGFLVRKDAKGHGTAKTIEGPPLRSGTRVVLVDDVVTTGKAFLEAREQVAPTGAEIVEAIAMVDREEGGRENLAAQGLSLHALFLRSDFPATNG